MDYFLPEEGMEMKVDKKVWVLAIYVLLFTILATFKLNTFQTTYEFGWEERLLVNTFKGDFYFEDDVGFNGLGSHFHIVNIAVMMPFYYIFHHSSSFFFIQASMMALTAFLLYFFSRKYFDGKKSNLVFYMFLLFPLVINTMLEDFHGIIYSAPIIAGLFLAYYKNKKLLTILLSIILVLVQEDMSLIVIMIGLYFWLIKKDRIGVKILLIGVLGFILIPNMIQPTLIENYAFYNEGKFVHYTYKFGYLGEDIGSILKTLITRPGYALTYTSLAFKASFIEALFLPLLLIPLLSPVILISTPIILEIILHGSASNICPNSYHVASIIPIMFISLILALNWLKKRFSEAHIKKIMKIMLLVVILLLVFGEVAHWFSEGYFMDKNFFGGDNCKKNELKLFTNHRPYFVSRNSDIRQALEEIPLESNVLVPFHLYSNFVRANKVKTFFEMPNCFDFDFIILDSEDLYFPEGEEFQSLLNKLTSSEYKIIFQKEDFFILKNINDKEVCV